MIPDYDQDNLLTDFTITSDPDKTYVLKTESNRILGKVEGTEAIRQAVYKILNTERYAYAIYSWDYGIELQDLIGKPIPYALASLESRITDALTQDDRISSVDSFAFKILKDGILASFTVHSNAGDTEIEEVISI